MFKTFKISERYIHYESVNFPDKHCKDQDFHFFLPLPFCLLLCTALIIPGKWLKRYRPNSRSRTCSGQIKYTWSKSNEFGSEYTLRLAGNEIYWSHLSGKCVEQATKEMCSFSVQKKSCNDATQSEEKCYLQMICNKHTVYLHWGWISSNIWLLAKHTFYSLYNKDWNVPLKWSKINICLTV